MSATAAGKARAVWAGTKKVAGTPRAASNARIRPRPTRAPYSPRDRAVGVVCLNVEIQIDRASKSKVRQTVVIAAGP